MTTFMQDGVTWLTGQLQEAAGVTVTYTSGGSSISVTAVPRMHDYETVDGMGIAVVIRSFDWIIEAVDIAFSEVVTEPKRGDTITYDGKTYQVMPVSKSHVFEPHDVYEEMLIVHTNCVAL